MSDWQPIKTAPRDSSWVLVFLSEPHTLGGRIHTALMRPDVMIIGGLFEWDQEAQPTHWMPLPEPPETEKDTADD